MRMPRFRIRTMMIVVAMGALSLWGAMETRRLHRWSSYYRQRAANAQKGETEQRRRIARAVQAIRDLEVLLGENPPKGKDFFRRAIKSLKADIARRPEGVSYYARLRRKYERAARYPWLAVEEDPEEPEWAIRYGWDSVWWDEPQTTRQLNTADEVEEPTPPQQEIGKIP